MASLSYQFPQGSLDQMFTNGRTDESSLADFAISRQDFFQTETVLAADRTNVESKEHFTERIFQPPQLPTFRKPFCERAVKGNLYTQANARRSAYPRGGGENS